MTLDQLRAQMQVFLDFRDVEHTLQADVDRIVGGITETEMSLHGI